MPDSKLLEVENLSVSFRQKKKLIQAVRGVSFSIHEKGKSLGIVGESGSGKSVTSLAVMKLIDQPPGEITADKLELNGVDLMPLGEKHMQDLRGSEIGMVFQEPMTSLDPVFTVKQQMIEAIILHQKVGKSEAVKIAAEMLTKVEIPSPKKVLSYYPHQLSGGMRQRIMIAIALSCNPKILIADEPTTALDVTIQAQVLQLLKDLQEQMGMALIIITHDLGVIAETVDQVVVMYGGKILEQGSVFEIFEEPAQPYTRALLRSIPKSHGAGSESLYSIEGSSPNPANPPGGCPFHPRCSECIDTCSKEFPETTQISGTHFAFCWRLS